MVAVVDKYRSKYPGAYDDMTDIELATAINKKYNGAYTDVVEEAVAEDQQRQSMAKEEGYQQEMDAQRTKAEEMFQSSSLFTRPEMTPEMKAQSQGFLDTTIPAAAGTVGAIIGGVSPLPGGAYVGGGFGTALGKQIANRIGEARGVRQPGTLTENMIDAGKDTVIGGAEEVVGAKVLGPAMSTLGDLAGKAIISTVPTKKLTTQRAADMYNNYIGDIPQQSDAIDQGIKLMDDIPGLKLSQGKINQDIATQKFESGADSAQDVLSARAKESNLKAVDDYIVGAKGSGSIDDTLNRVQRRKDVVNRNVKDAVEQLKKTSEKFSEKLEFDTIGKSVKDRAKLMEKAAIKRYGAPFRLATDETIPIAPLVNKADDLLKSGIDAEEGLDVPLIRNFYDLATKEGAEKVNVSPAYLQRFRSVLGEEMRIEGRGAGNKFRLKIMDDMMDAIDDSFNATDLGKELNSARELYKTNVIDKYRKGVAARVVKPGRYGDTVADGSVMRKFFTRGNEGQGSQSVIDFKNTFGGDPEMNAQMTKYVDNLMTSQATNPTTEQITKPKLDAFVSAYRDGLKQLGFENRYSSVAKAAERADLAGDALKEFDNSAAARLLRTDPAEKISEAFKKGKVGEASENLMKLVANDPSAKKGLQNALIDHVRGAGSVGNVTQLNSLMKKFAPAYESMFTGKEGKQKLRALQSYQGAIRRLTKSEQAGFFGGNRLAQEKFLTKFIQGDRLTNNPIVGWISGAKSFIQNMSNAKVEAILKKAAMDPEAAMALKSAVRVPVPELDNYLTRIAGGAADIAPSITRGPGTKVGRVVIPELPNIDKTRIAGGAVTRMSDSDIRQGTEYANDLILGDE